MSASQSPRFPVRRLVVMAMMTALIWLLMFTPIGFVALPIFGGAGMTTIHIPVVIGTMMEGLSAGTVLSGMFGLTSWFMAFRSADPTAVMFQNPLVSVLPRLLIGPATYGALVLVRRLFPAKRRLAHAAAALSGTLANTAFTLTAMMLWALAHPDNSPIAAYGVWTSALNLLFEAPAAMAISVAVMAALEKIYKPGAPSPAYKPTK